ncbi:hypothetical protein GE061_007530 [Apolygus lucorum]|uniref:PiggyBac transposable element-derived protein domain-containing protein n=1 Tax=Apolygus lucorum TaxID=248454 RepID=A0A6A4IZR4_APOLU|nr:hypothetical protein GE061_007530 [Apolygus lucorum]
MFLRPLITDEEDVDDNLMGDLDDDLNKDIAGTFEVSDSKDLKKKRRGSYDAAYDKKSNLSVVKWNDNSIVCVASNFDTVHPLSKTKRNAQKASRCPRKIAGI